MVSFAIAKHEYEYWDEASIYNIYKYCREVELNDDKTIDLQTSHLMYVNYKGGCIIFKVTLEI